jgi:hypothetical protein
MTEQVSWVKALQHYFSQPPHDRKVEMSEFKELTATDKADLREMLVAEGYDIAPLKEAA